MGQYFSLCRIPAEFCQSVNSSPQSWAEWAVSASRNGGCHTAVWVLAALQTFHKKLGIWKFKWKPPTSEY